MILSYEQLCDLLTFLDRSLKNEFCDGTMKNMKKWAFLNGVNQEKLEKSFNYFGAYCDCEVIYNIEPEEIFKDEIRFIRKMRT